jgi:hypothetical protein
VLWRKAGEHGKRVWEFYFLPRNKATWEFALTFHGVLAYAGMDMWKNGLWNGWVVRPKKLPLPLIKYDGNRLFLYETNGKTVDELKTMFGVEYMFPGMEQRTGKVS